MATVAPETNGRAVWVTVADGSQCGISLTKYSIDIQGGKKFRYPTWHAEPTAHSFFPSQILFTEILGLEPIYLGSSPWIYRFGIITFKRVKNSPNRWVKRRVVLRFRNLEHCQRWITALTTELHRGLSRY